MANSAAQIASPKADRIEVEPSQPPVAEPIAIEPDQPRVTAETFRRIIGGKPITRMLRTCRETNRTFYEYHRDPDIEAGEDHLEFLGGVSPDYWFARGEGANQFSPSDLCEADPLGDELKALAATYPRIAEHLGKGREAPCRLIEAGLFDLGPVSVERTVLVNLRASRGETIEALTKHVNGDLGRRGKVEPGRPPEDDIFFPLNLPEARAAAVAIHEKRGIIRSRHTLWTAEDVAASQALNAFSAFSGKQYHRTPESFLDVVTLLSGDKTRTLVTGSTTPNPY